MIRKTTTVTGTAAVTGRGQLWSQRQLHNPLTGTTSSQIHHKDKTRQKKATLVSGATPLNSCVSRISLIHKVNRNKFDFKTNLRTRGIEKKYIDSIPML